MLPGVVDGPHPADFGDSLRPGHRQALRVLPGAVDSPDPAEFGGGSRSIASA